LEKAIPMETISASDAKREFGEMILKAQKGPVGINKNGKPVAVMVSASAFTDIQAMQRKALQQAIDEGIADIKAGRVVDGEEVFASLRKQVLDAEL
jgi:prevent-host-death family protein